MYISSTATWKVQKPEYQSSKVIWDENTSAGQEMSYPQQQKPNPQEAVSKESTPTILKFLL